MPAQQNPEPCQRRAIANNQICDYRLAMTIPPKPRGLGSGTEKREVASLPPPTTYAFGIPKWPPVRAFYKKRGQVIAECIEQSSGWERRNIDPVPPRLP
jgi:hypothetical protein